MTAPKFKVGDRVRTESRGGYISQLDTEDAELPYCVNLDGGGWCWFSSDEITPELPPRTNTHAIRKGQPITRGVLDYFPDAIKAVAECSRVGNDQHNPGQDMHHARSKSSDHADCVVRHLMERGTVDTDGVRHSAKVAWRALALLQEELEAEGAPKARGAK